MFRIYEGINAGGMGHKSQQLRRYASVYTDRLHVPPCWLSVAAYVLPKSPSFPRSGPVRTVWPHHLDCNNTKRRMPCAGRAAFHGPYIKLLGRLAASEAGSAFKDWAAVTEKDEVGAWAAVQGMPRAATAALRLRPTGLLMRAAYAVRSRLPQAAMHSRLIDAHACGVMLPVLCQPCGKMGGLSFNPALRGGTRTVTCQRQGARKTSPLWVLSYLLYAGMYRYDP